MEPPACTILLMEKVLSQGSRVKSQGLEVHMQIDLPPAVERLWPLVKHCPNILGWPVCHPGQQLRRKGNMEDPGCWGGEHCQEGRGEREHMWAQQGQHCGDRCVPFMCR